MAKRAVAASFGNVTLKLAPPEAVGNIARSDVLSKLSRVASSSA
jgi:hypothetical protein